MERHLETQAHRPASGVRRYAGLLVRGLRRWHHNARTRRQLAELTSLQLADLGISPSERVREISKPFWR
ncbi:DUF1127 domain-containing protein [Pseudomonas multiresinivorans]|uniref:DUF1127 domain-containing protein n=1 Tax=Pseudomonas multiresinivorans TaxID=95301 RepID=A0A7Z3GP39_9PSED|nr:DUF1127 domain-containing protein [Pseudomonas multiresinivorans]QJP06770.1 DUF1127 domain-containing protein [Pseudomonas multiresinivorans]